MCTHYNTLSLAPDIHTALCKSLGTQSLVQISVTIFNAFIMHILMDLCNSND